MTTKALATKKPRSKPKTKKTAKVLKKGRQKLNPDLVWELYNDVITDNYEDRRDLQEKYDLSPSALKEAGTGKTFNEEFNKLCPDDRHCLIKSYYDFGHKQYLIKAGLNGKEIVASDEDIIEALSKCGGLITPASRLMGVSSALLRQRVRESERIMEAREEFREQGVEDVITALHRKAKEGDFPHIRYILEHLGYRQGFGFKVRTLIEQEVSRALAKLEGERTNRIEIEIVNGKKLELVTKRQGVDMDDTDCTIDA